MADVALTAGCDAYTVPFAVLRDFLAQRVIEHEELERKVEADYSADLGISGKLLGRLGMERIKRLYTVEPEFIEFLEELRNSREFATIDGQSLFRRFDRAGFGDVFFAPSAAEWNELRKSKLSDLDSPLTASMPIDTLYSLLAIGDFINFQDEMDKAIRDSIENLFQW
jgi:transaldolase